MPFPFIPLLVAAAAAGTGFWIFGGKEEKKAIEPGPTPAKPGPTPAKPGSTPAKPGPTPAKPGPTPVKGKVGLPTYPGQTKRGQGLDLPPAPPPKVLPGPAPLPAPPQPLPVPTPGGAIATVIAKGGLNVRSQPNTTGNILSGLTMGTKVKIPEPNNILPPTAGAPKGWYKLITPNGVTGYGSAEYLIFGAVSPLPAPPPSPAPSPVPIPFGGAQATVMAPSGLNVRNAPNTSGKLLILLPKSTIVSVLDSNPTPATPGAPQGWLKIQSGNTIGYSSAEFLNVTGGSARTAPAPTPEEQFAMRGSNITGDPDMDDHVRKYGWGMTGSESDDIVNRYGSKLIG